MQLRRIALRNIRSYEKADLDLGPGTTLVSGDVGSGKTSLLYAVEMALFGFAEVDAAYLVRHQAAEAEVRLTMTDDQHTYELTRRFSRRTRRGKDVFQLEENALTLDGAKTTYSTTELRQRAIDLLGFPDNPSPRAHSDLWRWAVYIPQERMREILDLKPEERLTTVRKALGLEQYQLAAENAQDVASDLRRTAENREAEALGLAHWDEELVRGREAIEARTSELASARPAEIRLRERLVETEVEFARVETSLRGFEDDEREWLRLGEERARVVSRGGERRSLAVERRNEAVRLRSRDAQQSAADLDSARSEEGEAAAALERLRARRKVTEVVRNALSVAIAESRAADDSERDSAEELRRTTEETERARAEILSGERTGVEKEPTAPTPLTLPQIDERLQTAQERVEAVQAETSRLELELHEVDELLHAGVCPRCRQTVRPAEFAAHHDEVERLLAESRARRVQAVAERDGLRLERARREQFERDHRDWLQVMERLALLRTAHEGANERLGRARLRHEDALRAQTIARTKVNENRHGEEFGPLERELGLAEERMTRASGRIQEAARNAERLRSDAAKADVLQAEAGRLDAEAQEAESMVHEIERRRADIELRRPLSVELQARRARLVSERERLRPELEETNRVIARVESQLAESTRRVDQSMAGVEERRRVSALAVHHRLLAGWISQPFREAVLKLEHRLLARAQYDFDRAFGRFFSTLIEDPSLVARSDVAFSPNVEIEGEWTPPEALSGGERTALALAYRLALGQVVRSAGRLKLDTLILDEPTDGFSPEQVTRMGELLEEIGIPQVILVSHEGGLASVADHVARVQKEDGLSTVTREGRGRSPPDEPSRPPELAPKEAPLGERRRRVRVPRLDASPGGPLNPETR